MLSSTEFHKDFSALRRSTNEIGVTGLRFDHEFGEEAMTALLREPSNPDFSWRAARASTASFVLERENEHSFLVHVNGVINLACTCGRCLEPMAKAVQLAFTMRMLDMDHLGITEESLLGLGQSIDMDLADDDDDELVGYFKDRTLDLGIAVRDQIFLMLPDYPHCEMGDDALQASRCKVLSSASSEADHFSDNPFVRKFGKTK